MDDKSAIQSRTSKTDCFVLASSLAAVGARGWPKRLRVEALLAIDDWESVNTHFRVRTVCCATFLNWSL